MKSRLITFLTLGFALSFLAFVVHNANELSTSREIITSSSNIIDVRDVIRTKVLVSKIDLPINGDWVNRNFDDSQWSPITIPSRQIVKEKDYAFGSYAYYRILLPKVALSRLSNIKNQLSLDLEYVLFTRTDIMVNGHLIKTTDNPKTSLEFVQIFPIPGDQDVLVCVKGRIEKPLDTGIDHRNEILVGKSSELNETYVSAFKRGIVFQLVFILCKGSILFIFALIFILLKVDTSFLKFFIFGLCTLIEELVAGDYLNSFIPFQYQVYIYNFANIGATVFVFLFFADLLKIKISKKSFWISFAVLSIVSTLVATDALHKNIIFDIGDWMKFWNLMTLSVMTYYLPKVVVRSDKILSFVLFLVIALYVWGIFPSNNIGLNFKRYGNLLLFVMVAYQTFVIFRRDQDSLQSKEKLLMEQEKDVAIGRTASLLAHDVRKPIDQIKVILESISSGEVDKEFIEIAKKDLDFSIDNVTSQINEMMNFSKTSQISLSKVSFYKVLSHGIKQVVSTHQEMDLVLEYNFKADMKIWGVETGLSVIVSNLVSNAIEAIRDIGGKFEGKVRFTTYRQENDFVFSVFNEGPLIPENIIDQVFKPLFTFGKSNGTGLGLASVVKAVNDHQGTVEVKNVGDRGVEFKVKFRCCDDKDDYDLKQFKNSSKDYQYKIIRTVTTQELDELRVLIFDVEDSQIKSQVKDSNFKIAMTHVSDIKSVVELIQKMRFDFYILNKKLGGEKIYQEKLDYLKDEVFVFEDHVEPKELCTLILNVSKDRKRLLFVDDTRLFQIGWQMFHGSSNIECVSSPEEALQILNTTSKQFDAYIIDFHFSNSSLDGSALAEKIKALRLNAKIFISSSIEQSVPGFKSISKRDYDVRKFLR